jgi:hypothetical protein
VDRRTPSLLEPAPRTLAFLGLPLLCGSTSERVRVDHPLSPLTMASARAVPRTMVLAHHELDARPRFALWQETSYHGQATRTLWQDRQDRPVDICIASAM